MKNFKTMLALLFAATLNHTQAQNLQNGLQACYPLDCDVSNMAATGSILDGTPVSVACTTGVSGAAGTAYAFSGSTGSYIQLPNNSLIKPTNAISFSGWVKFNSISTSQYLVFAQNTCSGWFEGYALVGAVVGSNFRLTAVKSGNSPCGTQHIVTGTTNLAANTWYHVGFYAGTDSLKVILNGAPEGTGMASTIPFNYASTNVYLGGSNAFYNLPFNGSMDNVRFYNRKLTPSEFNLLYTTNPACNVTGEPLLTDSLQACYPLDCSGTNMAATGSILDATPVGVSCAADRFGNASGAYGFANSTTSYISLPNNPKIRPTTRISFSGWVRFNSTTNAQYIAFTKNNCSAWFEGYALAATKVGSSLRLQIVKATGPPCGTQHVITGGTNLAANTWYHVGFYAGTDSIKLYLNGNPEGTPIVSTTAFNYDATTNVYLGGTNSGIFNLPLDGRLDDIRFYNRKLYNSEFQKLYNWSPNCNTSALGLTNGLQACYPLNCNAINYAPITAPVLPSLNGATYSVVCDTGHAGDLNGSYKFLGNANSYIELPNDSRIKSNALTFSCWSKIDVLATYQYILFTKNPCGIFFEGYALVATYSSAGLIKYQVVKAPGTGPCSTGGVVVNSTGTYNAYTWHHVAFYMDGSVIKLYVDGAAAGSTSSGIALNYDTNTKVYLGGTNQSYNYPLNGSIDNVRFYNRELVLSEINAIRTYDPSCDVVSVCGGSPSNCREAVTGIKEDKTAGNKIELYPNPSSGKLYISNAKDKSLVIYDMNGKVVAHTLSQIDETTAEINVTNNAAGLYFVRITDASGNVVQTSKIILTR